MICTRYHRGITYLSQFIPRAYLLNKDGVIVGTNLRGDALEPAVKKWL